MLPAFVVFNDAALRDMAQRVPRNREEFGHISGVGTVKLQQFGDRFLAEIQQYLKENPNTTKVERSSYANQLPALAKDALSIAMVQHTRRRGNC